MICLNVRYFLLCRSRKISFSALTLLVWHQEEKKLSDDVLAGYLSEANDLHMVLLMPLTSSSLASLESRML